MKLSGDGAKMTRMTNFVVLSYSLLDTDDMMSSKGMSSNNFIFMYIIHLYVLSFHIKL